MDSLTLKHCNSFQNENNRKATHSFDPRLLKLLQEVLKFNDICISWSSAKTDIATILDKLRKWEFQERQFLSLVTFN